MVKMFRNFQDKHILQKRQVLLHTNATFPEPD